ncbi:MAG TPA: RimK family alpha-L-glutamate ligase [Candidatus Bilamarchaeaceae archaeon]|nr:RimK family alpha-L-glutamate ligase [Candidatus Bilamarchaeaceae archaeon]
MKIWLLKKNEESSSYEAERFKEVASQKDIVFQFVVPEEFDLIVTKEGRKSIRYNAEYTDLPDCLLPRMGAGTTYFALAVIRHLERLGVFVLNSSQSIENAKDKLASLQILSSHNIPIPKTMLAKFPLNIQLVENEFSYPLLIKTVSGTHGKGVFLCENKSQLEDLADLIQESRDPKVNVIFQEFVSSSTGKDIRVIVVGGRPLGAMLRIAASGKFKANYSRGGEVERIELNPEMEWLAVESARLLNLDIAGVDLLFDGDSYKVCEVNSSPGFRGFEKATGINVPQEIYNYVRVRLGESM